MVQLDTLQHLIPVASLAVELPAGRGEQFRGAVWYTRSQLLLCN